MQRNLNKKCDRLHSRSSHIWELLLFKMNRTFPMNIKIIHFIFTILLLKTNQSYALRKTISVPKFLKIQKVLRGWNTSVLVEVNWCIPWNVRGILTFLKKVYQSFRENMLLTWFNHECSVQKSHFWAWKWNSLLYLSPCFWNKIYDYDGVTELDFEMLLH